MCFLDASKAFDRVKHSVLFNKLTRRGVPGYIVKLLSYWYAKQTMRVRWGDCISSPFSVSNRVRQGGMCMRVSIISARFAVPPTLR